MCRVKSASAVASQSSPIHRKRTPCEGAAAKPRCQAWLASNGPKSSQLWRLATTLRLSTVGPTRPSEAAEEDATREIVSASFVTSVESSLPWFSRCPRPFRRLLCNEVRAAKSAADRLHTVRCACSPAARSGFLSNALLCVHSGDLRRKRRDPSAARAVRRDWGLPVDRKWDNKGADPAVAARLPVVAASPPSTDRRPRYTRIPVQRR